MDKTNISLLKITQGQHGVNFKKSQPAELLAVGQHFRMGFDFFKDPAAFGIGNHSGKRIFPVIRGSV